MRESVVIEPIQRPRLSQQIAVEICRLIRQETFKAGDRLPAERDLARQLEVSRTSLREALRTLEISGIIESKHGGGTYVREISAEGAISPLALVLEATGDIVGDLWEVRIIFEPEIAARAALRATCAEIADAEALLEVQRKMVYKGTKHNTQLMRLDRQFHMQLARASHNAVSVQVVQLINQLLQEGRSHFITTEERRQRAYECHVEILNAIRAGDVEKARAAMLVHLQEVEEFILGRLIESEGEESWKR